MSRTLLALTRSANLRAALKPLRGSGLRVLQARTGLSALLLCACRPVDLAVMNLEEPGTNWPKLREKLSAAFPSLPVVAMTERDEPEALSQRIREALESTALRKKPVAESAPGVASLERRTA